MLTAGSRHGARVGLALACLFTLGTATAGPPTKVANAPYPPDFQSRVKKAIERGVEHLRKRQMMGEHDPAMDDVEYQEAAAVTWVLRRAGVAGEDPAFATASKRLRARQPKTVEEASLLLLALCSPPLPQGDPFAMEETARGDAAKPVVAERDRSLVESTTKILLGRQIKPSGAAPSWRAYDDGGGWGSDLDGPGSTSADIPSTYMALIALEAAARCGIQVPSQTWMAALSLLVGWQSPKGPAIGLKMNQVRGTDRFEWTETAHVRGFASYGTQADGVSGYETAAGTLGMVVCQDALQNDRGFTAGLRQEARVGIRDALGWIQQHFDIQKNPLAGGSETNQYEYVYHPHWLQGLARLAIHARMRFFGTHDWYREGAESLVKTQTEDGVWSSIWWSNCYPLLFLMRASLPSIVPVVTVTETDSGK